MKKIPMRKCIATQQRLPKKELIRVVRTTEHTVVVDLTGKVNGRGAYLQRSVEAIEIAKKTKVLNRALECEIPETVYEELMKIVNLNE
ncbi:MAG: YlxR family protein [Erysipelotrichaceae bacterium]|nr:YlxR family protein [Erysipelotrichaceae bacterium]